MGVKRYERGYPNRKQTCGCHTGLRQLAALESPAPLEYLIRVHSVRPGHQRHARTWLQCQLGRVQILSLRKIQLLSVVAGAGLRPGACRAIGLPSRRSRPMTNSSSTGWTAGSFRFSKNCKGLITIIREQLAEVWHPFQHGTYAHRGIVYTLQVSSHT
jgi:hypothetical protein